EAATREEIERLHLEVAPPRPSNYAPVAPAVDLAVLRCLEKNPGARYACPSDVVAALRASLGVAATPLEPAPTHAIALLGQVVLEGPQPAHLDDTLVDSLGRALDEAEKAMRSAGFAMPLVTGNTVLGASVLPISEDEARRAREEGIAVAQAIYAVMRQRLGA